MFAPGADIKSANVKGNDRYIATPMVTVRRDSFPVDPNYSPSIYQPSPPSAGILANNAERQFIELIGEIESEAENTIVQLMEANGRQRKWEKMGFFDVLAL